MLLYRNFLSLASSSPLRHLHDEELQLNLSVLFNVLGEHGPKLHRQLAELETQQPENISGDLSLDHLLTTFHSHVPLRCFSPDNESTTTRSEIHLHASIEQYKVDRTACDAIHVSDAGTVDASSRSENIGEESGTATSPNIFEAVLQVGGHIASDNPRDIPSHYCMHLILMHALDNYKELQLPDLADGRVSDRDAIIGYAQQYLVQCLSIAFQTASSGMTGWFEYGSSSSLDVASEQPMTIMYRLAFIFATKGSWQQVHHILGAVLARMESQLTRSHPMVLVTMLDLAGAAQCSGKGRFAKCLIASAVWRMSGFLAKMEHTYLAQLVETIPDRDARVWKPSFSTAQLIHPLSCLDSFVKALQRRTRLDLLSVFGPRHDVTLVTHSLVADTLALKANCLSMSEITFGTNLSDRESTRVWKSAHDHYMTIYDSCPRTPVISLDSRCMLAAYGVARCLRQVDQSSEAFDFLSKVLDDALDTVSSYRQEAELLSVAETETSGAKAKVSPSPFVPCAMPALSPPSFTANDPGAMKDLAIGYCQWLLAALCADLYPHHPARCLHQLQSCALSLQRALKDGLQGASATQCRDVLRVVVTETKRLMEWQWSAASHGSSGNSKTAST